MSSSDLLLSRFLWILWRFVLGLVDLDLVKLEVLELRLLDSRVGDLHLSEHASLLRELFQGHRQVFDLG